MILKKQIHTRKSLYLSNLVVLSFSYMSAWEAISQDIFEIASASGGAANSEAFYTNENTG